MSIALDCKPAGLPMLSVALPGERIVSADLPKQFGGQDLSASGGPCSSSPSSSSSIGRNSDLSSDGEDCGDEEAQSSYKGPLDVMAALEEVLPIRRGISNFYRGKSKSFTSLAEVSSSSTIEDISKPENAYTRRRRNLLAFNHVSDKNRNFPLRSHAGGISKRPLGSSRSTLAFAVAMTGSSDSIGNMSEGSRSPPLLPPLHPQSRSVKNKIASSPSQQSLSAWRSFSFADLQHCATSATANSYQLLTKPVIPN